MKTTSKALVWIIVVFVTGILFGSAVTFVLYQPERTSWKDQDSRKKRSPEKFVELMADKLELEPGQSEQFRALILESRDRFREAHRAANQQVKREIREELRSILRTDQLKKFDEIMSKAPRYHPLGREKKPQQ